MLNIGNEEQVRRSLEGKSGFSKEIENELIRRVAIAEKEQEEYEPLGKGQIFCFVALGVIGLILAIAPFF